MAPTGKPREPRKIGPGRLAQTRSGQPWESPYDPADVPGPHRALMHGDQGDAARMRSWVADLSARKTRKPTDADK
ncbi:MAG: hypothetical protein HY394_00680 [Candidatus Diapherotrites archaeon]|nr:hypothetical protein [Candidatus Diapherotrites archaeon]